MIMFWMFSHPAFSKPPLKPDPLTQVELCSPTVHNRKASCQT